MPYHKRKKHIRWGAVAIAAALLLAVLLALGFAVKALLQKSGDPDPASSPDPGTDIVQTSSSETGGGESDASSEETDAPDSSDASTAITSAGSTPAGARFSYDGSTVTVTRQNGERFSIPAKEIPEGRIGDWNLILLNHDPENAITAEIPFEKVKFDYQYCDARAAGAYQAMADGAKSAGITLFLRSGYRTMNEQRTNYNANVQRLLGQGLSNEEAIRQTNLYYTEPGHSEHHTGLAFDIITPEYHTYVYTLSEAFADTDAYVWLSAHCTDYGFILRYTKENAAITKINYEPWHYRYVGVDHAKFMEKYDLAFEEYIVLLKTIGR